MRNKETEGEGEEEEERSGSGGRRVLLCGFCAEGQTDGRREERATAATERKGGRRRDKRESRSGR